MTWDWTSQLVVVDLKLYQALELREFGCWERPGQCVSIQHNYSRIRHVAKFDWNRPRESVTVQREYIHASELAELSRDRPLKNRKFQKHAMSEINECWIVAKEESNIFFGISLSHRLP